MTWFGRRCGESSNAPVEAMRDIKSGLLQVEYIMHHEFEERTERLSRRPAAPQSPVTGSG
jgi:hypothetical protein